MLRKSVFFIMICGSLTAPAAPSETVLRTSHAMEYGGAENMDPYDPARFYPPISMVYSRLVRPDIRDGSPSPDLALSWSSNADATVWRLVLRQGVQFHDGRPFTAKDVAYSLMRIIDPEIDSPIRTGFLVVDSVNVVDEYTVDVNLQSTHADFPVLLMDYRVRMIPDGSGPTIKEHPIGTGPFIMVDNDPEGITRLKANLDYFMGPPGVDYIESAAIPDSNAAMQAFLEGQVDYTDITPRLLPLFEDNEDFVITRYKTGAITNIAFRTDVPPFDDARVRKALRVAIDRKKLINLVLGPGGGEVTCDHPVQPDDPYRWPGTCEPDPELAKRLLKEAGYESGLSFDVYTSNLFGLPGITLVEVYQQQLAEIGVHVNLIVAPADGYYTDVWMIQPVSVAAWAPRTSAQLNEMYRSGGSWNETYWSRPDFDALLDAAREELDAEKRKKLYWQLQETLYEEGGSFVPFNINNIRVHRKNISGFDPVSDFYLRWYKIRKTK